MKNFNKCYESLRLRLDNEKRKTFSDIDNCVQNQMDSIKKDEKKIEDHIVVSSKIN